MLVVPVCSSVELWSRSCSDLLVLGFDPAAVFSETHKHTHYFNTLVLSSFGGGICRRGRFEQTSCESGGRKLRLRRNSSPVHLERVVQTRLTRVLLPEKHVLLQNVNIIFYKYICKLFDEIFLYHFIKGKCIQYFLKLNLVNNCRIIYITTSLGWSKLFSAEEKKGLLLALPSWGTRASLRQRSIRAHVISDIIRVKHSPPAEDRRSAGACNTLLCSAETRTNTETHTHTTSFNTWLTAKIH